VIPAVRCSSSYNLTRGRRVRRRRYTDFVSRLQFTRAVCLTIATVLVGTPVLAATCELTCTHSSAKSHLSGSQASHHHHADATSADTDGVSTVVNSKRDCCRDTGLAATAAVNGRTNTNVFVTMHSLVPASAPFFQAIHASPTAPIRGAPPGRSRNSARPLPLRI